MNLPGKLILLFIVFSSFEKEVISEFRFCHHGPHKVDNKECPGGVMFDKPIPATCNFFLKEDTIGDGRVTVHADMCEPSTSEDADITQLIPTYAFGVPTIQQISYELDMNTPTAGVDPSTQQECVSSCFGNWIDSDTLLASGSGVGPLPDPEYEYPTLTEAQKAEQDKITEQLFMKLILDDLSEEAGELRVSKLLRASFIVMSTHCQPYITHPFISKTLDAFKYFSKNSNQTVKDVGVREFNELMSSLAQCRTFDRYDSFRILAKNCTDFPQILGAEIMNEGVSTVVIVTPDNNTLDPFIEASWQAVSFVNAQCFRQKGPDYNLNHVYEVAMETLFSKYILMRWIQPPQVQNENFWNNLMGTPNFKVELDNVNVCTKLAYASNPYIMRLERPFKRGPIPSIAFAKKRGSTEVPEAGEGWTKTEQEYWEMYDNKGGFKNVVKALGGSCYASDSEREAAKSTIMASCTSEP